MNLKQAEAMKKKWQNNGILCLDLQLDKQKSRSMLTNVGICNCDWQAYIFIGDPVFVHIYKKRLI